MTDINNGPTGITEPPVMIHGANGPAGPAIAYSLSPGLLKIKDTMMDVARWHAQLQVSFDRNLEREVLTVADDQG